MRQLVSVVTDQSIAYLVHDGDEAVQIAQVVNVGLDVNAVIRLGVNLSDALALNGVELASPNATRRAALASGKSERALPPAAKRTPKPESIKRHSGKWAEIVFCPVPGCDYTAKRSNLPSHLRTKKHGWDRARATAAAHTARAVDSPPAVDPQRSTRLRGKAGAQRIATVHRPAVLRYLEAHDTIGVDEVLELCDISRGGARKLLYRMADIGELVDISPADLLAGKPRSYSTPANIARESASILNGDDVQSRTVLDAVPDSYHPQL